MLTELEAEMVRQTIALEKLGAERITREITETEGIPLHLLWVDELKFYFSNPEHGGDIFDRLCRLASVYWAVELIPMVDTQRPSAHVIDPAPRNLLLVRFAVKCADRNASEAGLDEGKYSGGFDASQLPGKGIGILAGHDVAPQIVRPYPATGATMRALCQANPPGLPWPRRRPSETPR
jgi:hypothetical protein